MEEALVLAHSQSVRDKLKDALRIAGVRTRACARPATALKYLDYEDFGAVVLSVECVTSPRFALLLQELDRRRIARFVAHDPAALCLQSNLPPGTINVSLSFIEDLVMRVTTSLRAREIGPYDSNEALEHHVKAAEENRRNLEQELEAKTRFLANVSHELRTPLTSIREFASLMLDEIGGPVSVDQRDFLSVIISNVDYLTDIIQDLLQISEIEEGRLKLVLEPVDIVLLVEKVVNQLGTARMQRAPEYTDLPPDLPSALADETRITQVLTNLLSNALKFTPADGSIHVRAGLDGDFIRVLVQDTGRGIDSAHQEKIFDRFYQVDDPLGPSKKGTGLGLNIAREIVEAHRGCIEVTSKPEEGSTFSFTLPIFSTGDWLRGTFPRTQKSSSESLISIKAETATPPYLASQEDLEIVAYALKRVLRTTDRLIVVPPASLIYVIVRASGKRAIAVRDRLIQRIQKYHEADFGHITLDIRIEEFHALPDTRKNVPTVV